MRLGTSPPVVELVLSIWRENPFLDWRFSRERS
jgi:hypothetical protein